jgi:hypothetical protein
VTTTRAKRVLLLGDCTVALDWISICVPVDCFARKLVKLLIDAQLSLGFVVRTEWRSNRDPEIVVADQLSRGCDVIVQELTTDGYAKVQYAPYQR